MRRIFLAFFLVSAGLIAGCGGGGGRFIERRAFEPFG